jgi:signal transduction histidine kinase
VGVISLMRSDGPPFGEPDARLAEELADRAALAIDNARLYRAAQRERAALSFLAEASAVLSSSLDYDQTFQRLAQLVVPRFGDWCGVEVLERGELRHVAVAHVDAAKVKMARDLQESYPTDLKAPAGVANVLRTGRSELYAEIPDELLVKGARDPQHLKLLRALALRSVLIVPLAGLDGPIGALNLVWSESGRTYGQDDVALMEELGRRAGTAVENARLYKRTQESLRLRDEFLSIASHELKTPLTSLELQIGGLRRSLAKGKAEQITEDKLAAKVGNIDRQVHRLGKLVDTLLDVSRASAGPLQLEPSEVELAQLVREVAAGFEDDLAKANCLLELRLVEGVVGKWDRMRLAQVISNFVSNALKYGPGAPIEIAVSRRGDTAVLTVRDHGIGIAPADQRRIFERFARAVSTDHYSGLGLGLWIVLVLVEAMGGTVGVESAPGAGSTFTVGLPALPAGR